MNRTICLANPQATARLAALIGGALAAQDVVLLQGPVGAGKSHFARALIRHLGGQGIEVPSPSFTLVQTYDLPQCPVWHIDLYRLNDAGQLPELGLEEAFLSGITLVEWPEILGQLRPQRYLLLELLPDPLNEFRRTAKISSTGRWQRLETALADFDA